MSEFIVKPERPGGFIDYLPTEYLARENMLRIIEKVFRSFGFDPIETPRIEFLRTLSGESSDTGKNIFHIKGTDDDEPLAMPFDHTVPFARLLAANPYDPKKRTGIKLPWRRMVVGPVFRSDTPQSGRYRQFYQFDADIAGASSMAADAEIVALIYITMQKLGVNRFVIRLNNRKILNGLGDSVCRKRSSVPYENMIREMMRTLDKADKIGLDHVIEHLRMPPKYDSDPTPYLTDESVDTIKAFLQIKGTNKEKLIECKKILKNEMAQQGIDELQQILTYLESTDVPTHYIDVDFSIARGLDYYTGPVMETILCDALEFGSVFSGGRYNNLVSRFTGKELPAVGASIGVDRLFAALVHLSAIDLSKQTDCEIMVIRLTKDHDIDYFKMASEIRQTGKKVELNLSDDLTFKAQFNFAISRGVKYVVICGDNEFQKDIVQIKNLETRKQEEIPRIQLATYFKA